MVVHQERFVMTAPSRLGLRLAPAAPPMMFAGTASAQEQLPPPPTAQPLAPEAAAQGQWVYTDSYGWVWVPAGATSYQGGAAPCASGYPPSYGWTWYVSPWGPGRFYNGPWVHTRWGAPHVWAHGGWV